jgi:hypothetical protein
MQGINSIMQEPFSTTGAVDHIEAAFGELARDVNVTSQATRNSWLFYVALQAYFFIALAGVTHKDLLLQTPFDLPLLQVKIGLRPFFIFAPLILTLMHFGVLLQHAMLGRKARELDRRIANFEGPQLRRSHRIRMQLHTYFFTQAIAGPYVNRLLLFFLHCMGWVTLVLLPLALLIDFQIRFLPVHDLFVTWTQRLYLVVDFWIVLLFSVFMSFPEHGLVRGLGAYMVRQPGHFIFTSGSWAVALFFSFFVATIPGETFDRAMCSITTSRVAVPYGADEAQAKRHAFLLTAVLFEGQVDYISGRLSSVFARNLMVTDADLAPLGGKEHGPALSLRRRDLRYATFDRSDLYQADMTGAFLSGASLKGANLSKLKAEQADFRGADLTGADLQDANLSGALLDEGAVKEVQAH